MNFCTVRPSDILFVVYSLTSRLILTPPISPKMLFWVFKRMRFGQGRQRSTMRVTNLGAFEVANLGGSAERGLADAQGTHIQEHVQAGRGDDA